MNSGLFFSVYKYLFIVPARIGSMGSKSPGKDFCITLRLQL